MNNTTSFTKLHHKLVAVTAERDHWKANHDNRVNAAKILMDRTDMPLERVGAYKQYVAALEENQKLRDALIAAETKLAKLLEQEPIFLFRRKGMLDYCTCDRSRYVELHEYPDLFDVMCVYAAPIPALADDADWKVRAEAAEAELVAVREDCHSMMLEIDGLRTERDRLADELTKLREQEPVAIVAESGRLLFAAGGSPEQYIKNKTYRGPLYSAPVAAPAAPADLVDTLAGIALKCTDSDTTDAIDALLQSADHSEQDIEKLAPDCRASTKDSEV